MEALGKKLQNLAEEYKKLNHKTASNFSEKMDKQLEVIQEIEDLLRKVCTLDQFLSLGLKDTSIEEPHKYGMPEIFYTKFKSLFERDPIGEYDQLKDMYEVVHNKECRYYLVSLMSEKIISELDYLTWKDLFVRNDEIYLKYQYRWKDVLLAIEKKIKATKDLKSIMEILKYRDGNHSYIRWVMAGGGGLGSRWVYPGLLALENLKEHSFGYEEALEFLHKEVLPFEFSPCYGDQDNLLKILFPPISEDVEKSIQKINGIEALFLYFDGILERISPQEKESRYRWYSSINSIMELPLGKIFSKRMVIFEPEIAYSCNVSFLQKAHRKAERLKMPVQSALKERLLALEKVGIKSV